MCYQNDACENYAPGTLVIITRPGNTEWQGLAEIVADAESFHSQHMYVVQFLNGTDMHGETLKLYCHGMVQLEHKI